MSTGPDHDRAEERRAKDQAERNRQERRDKHLHRSVEKANQGKVTEAVKEYGNALGAESEP